jgi:lipopolysaccharide biosynthesis protein
MKNCIAIVLHLYYTDLWEEFKSKLLDLDVDFDLYISLTNGNNNIEGDVKNSFPNAKIFWFDNKGMDIGPFFSILKYFIENDLNYKYLIKLHTKKSIKSIGEEKGINWRIGLVNSLIGSSEIFKKNISSFEDDKNINIGGNPNYFYRDSNLDWLRDELYNLKMIKDLHNSSDFDDMLIVSGTMFMVRYKVYREFFKISDIDRILSQLTNGYERDKKIEHKLERILSYIPQLNGSKILEL